MPFVDHFVSLGIDYTSDITVIRKAWCRACLASHPDRPGGSVEKQQAVNTAWEVLGDENHRTFYLAGYRRVHPATTATSSSSAPRPDPAFSTPRASRPYAQTNSSSSKTNPSAGRGSSSKRPFDIDSDSEWEQWPPSAAGMDSDDDFEEISPEAFSNRAKGTGKGNATEPPKKKRKQFAPPLAPVPDPDDMKADVLDALVEYAGRFATAAEKERIRGALMAGDSGPGRVVGVIRRVMRDSRR
ncbi:hypothetical protein F5883DRAFT_697767 [Diaporthe sp. PMI_573]|nr:hypothetical protein F5883DRAFT_697767 [Diaporthaceae sp. PMI_573]